MLLTQPDALLDDLYYEEFALDLQKMKLNSQGHVKRFPVPSRAPLRK